MNNGQNLDEFSDILAKNKAQMDILVSDIRKKFGLFLTSLPPELQDTLNSEFMRVFDYVESIADDIGILEGRL